MARALSVETVRPDELSAREIALWRSFVVSEPRCASPFFHPSFTRVAGQIAPGAAVAVLHRAGEIVGFFPHQRRGASVQPLGAPLNDYHGVIARPGAAPALEAMPALLGASSVTVNGWNGAGEGEGLLRRRTLQAALPDGWSAYDAERRGTWRKYFRDKDRSRRTLERDHGAVELMADETDPAALDRLLALKSAQYRRSGRHDIFACGWTADLLRALLATREPDFGARLATLRTDGRGVAFEFALHTASRYHFWLPAYEAGMARYSPGILLSLETMRHGAGEGFSVFDFGFAEETYKKYFCNREETMLEGVVHLPGFTDAISAALWMVGAESALEAGAAFARARLGLSVRRRWAAIDACETTFAGRMRGVAAAATAAIGRASAVRPASRPLETLDS